MGTGPSFRPSVAFARPVGQLPREQRRLRVIPPEHENAQGASSGAADVAGAGRRVVIAMASAITGINRSITGILEAAGPKTFYVVRYFFDGLEISTMRQVEDERVGMERVASYRSLLF